MESDRCFTAGALWCSLVFLKLLQCVRFKGEPGELVGNTLTSWDTAQQECKTETENAKVRKRRQKIRIAERKSGKTGGGWGTEKRKLKEKDNNSIEYSWIVPHIHSCSAAGNDRTLTQEAPLLLTDKHEFMCSRFSHSSPTVSRHHSNPQPQFAIGTKQSSHPKASKSPEPQYLMCVIWSCCSGALYYWESHAVEIIFTQAKPHFSQTHNWSESAHKRCWRKCNRIPKRPCKKKKKSLM